MKLVGLVLVAWLNIIIYIIYALSATKVRLEVITIFISSLWAERISQRVTARITQNHPTDCSQQMSHLFYQYHVGREFRVAVKQLKACCLACHVPMLHPGNHMFDTDSSGFPEENAR